jgi:hypothetical protein
MIPVFERAKTADATVLGCDNICRKKIMKWNLKEIRKIKEIDLFCIRASTRAHVGVCVCVCVGLQKMVMRIVRERGRGDKVKD